MITFKKIFSNFSLPYIENAEECELPDYQLKYDHSLRVLDNCQGICDSLNIDEKYASTYKIAALFHDTGRFPQYLKYKTFSDAKSCNHATLGVKYILRKKLLADLPKSQLRIILGAVALHNRNILPSNISKELKFTTEIVRDSDKIDIMGVLLKHMKGVEPLSSVPLLGLKEKPDELTESVLLSLEACKQAAYREMNCLNDFRLLLLSWSYDLNFKWTKKQMIERGIVERIFSQLPKNQRIKKLYVPIMKQLNS
ncbi:HD domain-containing protein [Maridesulfovibrio ferrireducens]|uniref:HD domain-containing protein n=1 Tax=Maridesulfovibrio ferrireducens TaxID=246191 RepID=A0A1G9HSX1_9BACT|nr:HD domain-containing protein [Maridesulfovibrio ferrireducens]SDL16039.1 HD domain-containing protein [Maridesulfovibrio ferrireducens]